MSKVEGIRGRKRRTSTTRGEGSVGMDVTYLPVAKREVRADISRQVDDNETFALDKTASKLIIPTPFNMKTLNDIHEISNTLRQCIESYATNITSGGYRVVPAESDGEMDEAERATLQSFIDSANTEETLRSVQHTNITRYEKYGFTYLEVIRDKRERVSLLKAASPASIRMTRRLDEEVNVVVRVDRGGRRSRIVERKRFRVYVQEIGVSTVYYKEFGDPRRLNYLTGEFATETKPVPEEMLATELLHIKQESEEAYGIPRWISMLPVIMGSRESEEVNLRYFEDNTVPPMIITVAGGKITQQSYTDLQDILQGKGVGKERQNQIMLLEAIPEVADLDGKGTVSLQIEKLSDARQSDGLFKEYDEANSAKVRSAFRLPPVFLGLSQDMTFATANVSAYIAEVQVFNPERVFHDETLNKRIINHPNGLDLKTVKLESRGPSNSSPDQTVQTLTALNVMGGLTPRTAIDAVNETMRLSIPQYPEKGQADWMEWMDQPMTYSMANSKAQQTGEGKTTHAGQSAKDAGIKDTEATGKVVPKAPEHGQE